MASLTDGFFELFRLLESDALSSTNLPQALELEHALRVSGIFSSNESARDLKLSNLKYFLIDYIVACVHESVQEDRFQMLGIAKSLHFRYLERCVQYEMLDTKESIDFKNVKAIFEQDSDDSDNCRLTQYMTNTPRDLKIVRARRIMELRNRLTPIAVLETCDEGFEIEDEAQEQMWRAWIEYCALSSIDRLGLILREIEVLKFDPNAIENSLETIPDFGRNSVTQIKHNFRLVRDRNEISKGVFKSGHNLPTMTIDEYLDLERKRGNIISGGGAQSAHKPELNEDDDEASERDRQELIRQDILKDLYRRGSGNTYNRS